MNGKENISLFCYHFEHCGIKKACTTILDYLVSLLFLDKCLITENVVCRLIYNLEENISFYLSCIYIDYSVYDMTTNRHIC